MALTIQSNIAPIALGLSRWSGKGDLRDRLQQEEIAGGQLNLQKIQLQEQIANQALNRSMQRQQFAANYDLQQKSMAMQQAAAARGDQLKARELDLAAQAETRLGKSFADQTRKTSLAIEGLEDARTERTKLDKSRMTQLKEWDAMKGTMDPEEWTRGRIAILQGKTPARPATAATGDMSAYQEFLKTTKEQQMTAEKVAAEKEAAAKLVEPLSLMDVGRFAAMLKDKKGKSTLPGKEYFAGFTAEKRNFQSAAINALQMAGFNQMNTVQQDQLLGEIAKQAQDVGYSAEEIMEVMPKRATAESVSRYKELANGDKELAKQMMRKAGYIF
jgi:hypothetical protein